VNGVDWGDSRSNSDIRVGHTCMTHKEAISLRLLFEHFAQNGKGSVKCLLINGAKSFDHSAFVEGPELITEK
jgi:hypothetical protein